LLNLHKIERLPRNQRLRKIEKVFSEAENRLAGQNCGNECVSTNVFSGLELAFFSDLAGLLQKDTFFQGAVASALKDAALVLSRPAENALSLARAFNTIRHIIITETGRSVADWDFIGQNGVLDASRRSSFPGMNVYLEDIRSPFNVGAMFRTAESFGAHNVFVSPLCADPMHPRSRRSAMGCVEVLPWKRLNLLDAGREGSHECGLLPIFALETGGVPLEDFPFPRQGILVVGSEELGVNPKTLAAADASLGRVSVPSCGAKGSLNVSVVFGLAMYFWAKKCGM